MLEHLNAADRELVSSFFGEFAAAEFQLKALGYIKRGSEDAQADWETFATSVRRSFKKSENDPEFVTAWSALTEHPPRKQVIKDGALAWKETLRAKGQSDEDWALLLVRRVRNNLFHGGKFLLADDQGYERDRSLVRASSRILRAALDEARPRVKKGPRRSAA